MTEQSSGATGSPVSFPEFDAPSVPDPAPSRALHPELPAPSAPEAPEPSKAPEKEASGAKDTGTPATPPSTDGPKPDEGTAADDAAEPEPGPFQFAGRGFKDAAAAEHYLKSQEGRAKAAAKRESDLTAKASKAEAERVEAIRVAHAWKEHAEKGAQPQVKPSPEAEKAPEKDWLETLDWKAVKQLAETEGIEYAMFHALKQARDHMAKDTDAKLNAATAPYQQEATEKKVYAHVVNLFQGAADLKYDDGSSVYPELNEGEKVNAEIANIWRALDPRIALTEQGVDYAILAFRNQRAKQKPKDPAPSGAPDVVRQLTDAATRVPEPLNGGGVPRPADQSDPRARFKAEFVGAGALVKAADGTDLGFMP